MVAWRDPSRHPVSHQLDRWHVNRCNWIISRILEDPEFAQRVRTLKVYASGSLDIISPQMGQLRLPVDPNISLMLHSFPSWRSSKAEEAGNIFLLWVMQQSLGQHCRHFT
jgi:hypothetical protein